MYEVWDLYGPYGHRGGLKWKELNMTKVNPTTYY